MPAVSYTRLLRGVRQEIAPRRHWIWCAAEALDDDLRRAIGLSVEPLVGVAILLDTGSIQRHAREQPARARVAQDLRAHLHVGGRLGVATDRSGRNACVGADLELVARELLESFLVDHH